MSILSSEHIYGYDVRINIDQGNDDWFVRYTTEGALRRDITIPRSIDWIIWPPLFWQDGIGEFQSNVTDYMIGLPEGFWTGTFRNLWKDLDNLFEYIKQRRDEILCEVSIVGLSSVESEATKNYPELFFPDLEVLNNPPVPQSTWKKLGYDVVESGFYSAIYGWSHGRRLNREYLETHFGVLLNEYHLFERSVDAVSYTDLVNVGIPQHSPFIPCGLYEITRMRF